MSESKGKIVNLSRIQRSFWILFLSIFLFSSAFLNAHDRHGEFVTRRGGQLVCNGLPFYAIGVNCYFLQNLAAYGDTFHIAEVFQEAKQLGVITIRTWGFFDSADSTNPAVIQWEPGKFNERGLRALDYVVARAKEFSVRLIIPLVNNWEDYGGMNQYVRWYANQYTNQSHKPVWIQQRTITGIEGRRYRYYVAGSLTHDDFYKHPIMIQWYKNYISTILNRTNTITNISYKDEPAILAWELANEPRSSDVSGQIVLKWADEMSSFIKSIDTNHLVATGEEGFDVSSVSYRDLHSYNDQDWLFNGTGGVSYSRNITLPNIDIAGIHLYPETWHLSLNQGLFWLNDHQRIADAAQKPLILGEVGVKRQRKLFYDAIFNEGYFGNTAGILPWQFVYDERPDNDGFAFSFPKDATVCSVIKTYAEQFDKRRIGAAHSPTTTHILQNYPNPFNQMTAISYDLSAQYFVRMEVFDALGRSIFVLSEGEQMPGTHISLFDGSAYTSGTYFIRLMANKIVDVQKICLIK
jgi:mannan endo-1,4-beta-mannosidase